MIDQRLLKQQKGVATIEAALFTSLILVPIFLGIVQMVNIFAGYISIVNATKAGATYFVNSGSNFVNTNALAIVQKSASTLNGANLSITTTVNGVICTSCATNLKTKANFGTKVTFAVNYAYTPILNVSYLNFLPSTLTYTIAVPAPSF